MNPVLVGIASSFLGLVLYVVGIATPAWLSVSVQGQAESVGLWQICATVLGQTACASYPDLSQLKGSFHATRAFAVIGALLLVSGLGLACLATKNNSGKGKKIGGALIIAAGLCGVIAAAIFTSDTKSTPNIGNPPPFGYSFYLTWVQTVFTIGGGAAIVFAGRREASQDEIPVLGR